MAAQDVVARLLEASVDPDDFDAQAFIDRVPTPVWLVREWFEQRRGSQPGGEVMWYPQMGQADAEAAPQYQVEYDLPGDALAWIEFLPIQGKKGVEAGWLCVYWNDFSATSGLTIIFQKILRIDTALVMCWKLHSTLVSGRGNFDWTRTRLDRLEKAVRESVHEAADPDDISDPTQYILGSAIPIDRLTSRQLRAFFRQAGYRVASIYKGRGKRSFWSFLVERPGRTDNTPFNWQDEDMLKAKLMGWLEQTLGPQAENLRVDAWSWDGQEKGPEGALIQTRRPSISVDIGLNTLSGAWGESQDPDDIDPGVYIQQAHPPLEVVVRNYGYWLSPASRDPNEYYKKWPMPDGRWFISILRDAGLYPKASGAKPVQTYWVIVNTMRSFNLPYKQIAFAQADDESLLQLLDHVEKVGDYVRTYAVPDGRLQTDFIQNDWDVQQRIVEVALHPAKLVLALESKDPDDPEAYLPSRFRQEDERMVDFMLELRRLNWEQMPDGRGEEQHFQLDTGDENHTVYHLYVYPYLGDIYAYGQGRKTLYGYDRQEREQEIERTFDFKEQRIKRGESGADFAARVSDEFQSSPDEPSDDDFYNYFEE